MLWPNAKCGGSQALSSHCARKANVHNVKDTLSCSGNAETRKPMRLKTYFYMCALVSDFARDQNTASYCKHIMSNLP